MQRATLWILLALLTGAVGGAQAAQLVFHDVANTVRWYQTEMTLNGTFAVQPLNETMPATGKVAYLSRETVTGVNPDGTATVVTEITAGHVQMSVQDQTVDQPLAGYKVTFTRAPSGKVTNVKVAGQPQGELANLNTMGFGEQWRIFSNLGQAFEFPANDLRPGAKWTNKNDVAIAPGQTASLVLNNILRDPSVANGITCQSIDSDAAMTLPKTTITIPVGTDNLPVEQTSSMTGKSNTLFDTAAGEIVATSFTGLLKIGMTMALADLNQSVTINGDINLTGGTKKITAADATKLQQQLQQEQAAATQAEGFGE